MEIGHNMLWYKVVGSTNDLLKQHYQRVPHGTVIIADAQTKGRGRFRRRWYSGKEGLWFSMLIKHKNMDKTFLLAFAAAVSVANVVNELGLCAVLKWPNDVLINNKKVCGILTENIIAGRTVSTIVGVGINVNNKIRLLSATTLKTETGKTVDREMLLKNILRCYNSYYNTYKIKHCKTIMDDWMKHWGFKGEKVKLKTVRGVVEGTALGIDNDGGLIVKTAKNKNAIVVEGDLVC